MRRLRISFSWLLLGLLLSARGQAGEADLLRGLFWTPEHDAKIKFSRTRDGICGKIVWMKEPGRDDHNPVKELRPRPLVGLEIIRGFVAAEADRWQEGTVYDPETGNTYRGKIWFEQGDYAQLHLRGFVALPWFGRTEIFQRVEPE